MVELAKLLKDLSTKTTAEFASAPEVIDGNDELDVTALAITARKWTRMNDVVVVVSDLKNSTQLGTGSTGASTASIYETGTGGIVSIFNTFDANFIQIQGDGAFAIFWGDRRYERAVCAGITVKTNSLDLAEQIEAKWTSKPVTGFKVGIASGRVLVKKVGTPRDPEQQEPVWAGKPVNFATKAAQSAERHQMVVTGSVWDRIASNDYLTFSCTCNDPNDSIWEDFTIERLADDEPERSGRLLTSAWCAIHGEEYCSAILAGQKRRAEINDKREAMLQKQMSNAIRSKAQRERTDRRARVRGLSA